MGQDSMRAGDQDRQRVADRLRVALDEGRLDLSEYDERVQQAYAAKTYADLDGLLDDLPGPVPLAKSRVEPHRPAAAPASAPEEACERDSRPGYHGMLAVFVVCTLVWALSSLGSGEFLYFWPGWVLIPVVFAVFAHLGNRGKRRH